MRIVVPILFFLSATNALANARSAVSVNGLDTNPCTPASPCRSFGAAIAVTSPGGEIIALDSAGYGPFTVSTALTISGAPGVHAAITVTGAGSATGITVNTGSASDKVILRNLILIGSGGGTGIDYEQGAELTVFNVLVRGFVNFAVLSDSPGAMLNVQDCAILDNGTGVFADSDFTNPARVLLTHCSILGNGTGVSTGYDTWATIVNSTISGNSSYGIYVTNIQLIGNTLSQVMVENCTIANNGTGIAANAMNAGVFITISQNVIAFNQTGAAAIGAGVINSFGNNRFVGNGTDGGPFGSALFH
jgi:hypothetical protein